MQYYLHLLRTGVSIELAMDVDRSVTTTTRRLSVPPTPRKSESPIKPIISRKANTTRVTEVSRSKYLCKLELL
ncbi:hypothetical protein ACHWQZ_G004156 [Mnemiopsis leidyi]